MDKRQQILNSALENFVLIGFQGTPTSLIAKTAGVATGTLFYHFKTKEDLIDTLYLELKYKFIDYVFSKVHSGSTLKSQIQKIWIRSVNYAYMNKLEHQFLLIYANSPFLSEKTKGKVDEFYQCFHKPIEDGLSSKVLRDLPIDALFLIASHNIFAVVEYLYKNEEKIYDRQFMFEMFDSFWNSLKA